jgi:hypothetical protein
MCERFTVYSFAHIYHGHNTYAWSVTANAELARTTTSRKDCVGRDLIAQDPFAVEGLIDEQTILEWTPMFGSLDGTGPVV